MKTELAYHVKTLVARGYSFAAPTWAWLRQEILVRAQSTDMRVFGLYAEPTVKHSTGNFYATPAQVIADKDNTALNAFWPPAGPGIPTPTHYQLGPYPGGAMWLLEQGYALMLGARVALLDDTSLMDAWRAIAVTPTYYSVYPKWALEPVSGSTPPPPSGGFVTYIDTALQAAVSAAATEHNKCAAIVAAFAGDVTFRIYGGSTHLSTCTHAPFTVSAGAPKELVFGARNARAFVAAGTATELRVFDGATERFRCPVTLAASVSAASADRLNNGAVRLTAVPLP
jgi:hypothetical protein